MKIAQKFKYLYPEGFIHDAVNFLKKAKGEVDWFGNHVLTMEDCDDKMAWADFINSVLAPHLVNTTCVPDIATRIEALSLIDKVRALMDESVRAKNNAWVVKYLGQGLDREITAIHDLELKVRAFSKTSFDRLFPGKEPVCTTSVIVCHKQETRFVASRPDIISLYSPV